MRREYGQLYRIIRTQLALLCLATLLLLFASWHIAYSFLLGSLCCFIPNFIFGRQLFRYQQARQAREAMRVFYRGEAFKLALIAVLTLIVFTQVHILPGFFFAGFIAAQITFWVSSGYWLRKTAQVSLGVRS
jgi:ATP synthase protein I